MKQLLKVWHHARYLSEVLSDPKAADPDKTAAALRSLGAWTSLAEDDVQLPLRQKGVDMRIGLDITTMTLKRQVETGRQGLHPGRQDCSPRGVEFILDPMWQSVENDLMEHIDGLSSGLDRLGRGIAPPSADNSDDE